MVSMDTADPTQLWQALHAACEEHNPEEIQRLLDDGTVPPDCQSRTECSDLDKMRWLQEGKRPAPAVSPPDKDWPSRQENQLQCDALPEAERPACILDGEWEKPPTI